MIMMPRYVGATVRKRVAFFALGFVLLVVVSILLGTRHTDAQGAGQAVPVDGQILFRYTAPTLNSSTNTFDSLAKFTNTGTTPVFAPISLVITSVTPASVQLANSTGVTTGGLRYLTVLNSGSLNPGATLLTPIILKFNNPDRVSFTFTQSILGVVSSANHTPVADAGRDQTVRVAENVQLDGTQSTDVDGDPLTYRWSFVSIPGGSQASLANATTVNPSFVADKPGTYTVQLVANDGQVDSAPATVVISTLNSAPVANAGPNQLVASGTTVQLDGSHSTDVDGDALSYHWSFISVPAGSQAQLASTGAVTTRFLADKPGAYALQLIVNDGQVDSAPANVIISTQSTPPAANAGPDQTVIVGANVQLDGSKSAAANGGALTYRWALITVAPGSAAALVNPTKVNPTFVLDKAGIYIVQLIVNDGQSDSAPNTVVITTENSRPVADAGPNQGAQVGQTVTLDGTGSHDADNDALSFSWSLLTKPANSIATIIDADQPKASLACDLPGTFIAQLIVSDGQLDSPPATTTVTVTVAPPNHDPQISSTPLTSGQQGVAYSYQVVANDPDGDALSYTLTIFPTGMSISGTGLVSWTPSGSGTFSVGIRVTDGRGGSTTQSFNLVIAPALVSVPNVVGLTQAAATTAIRNASLALGSVTQQTSATAPAGTVISQSPPAVTLVEQGSAVNFVVSLGSVVLPPDPATVAPPLDPTGANSQFASTAFLYSGANPIQTGVAPGTIDLKRNAVLRGKVTDSSGAPLTGVTISIVTHPEFGQTLSRLDGMFDMAANGGGRLTVQYAKPGFLPAQRQVLTHWQEFTVLPDVVLLARDPQVTMINFGNGLPAMAIARGSMQTDADGSRQATVLFPAGTTAALVQPDGSTLPASTLNVRLTEYTVAANGPKAMPGDLPPTSTYTYAVELGADEAMAKVNGRDVVFNQPVIFYVENFMHVPVGQIVPVGFYDPAQSTWISAPNGQVIKLLGVTAGLADLDTDGDGVADAGTTLAALGITSAERQQLATLYAPGTSLWRTPMDHFSTNDQNWSFVCIPTDCGPPDETFQPTAPTCQSVQPANSVIGCERQTLGEDIPIVGTPFTLHYESDRVPGRTAEQGQLISLASHGVPNGVKAIQVEILVAGQKLTQSIPTSTGATSFAWDGNDAYGRPLNGAFPVTIRVGYTYDIVATVGITVPSSWARFSGIPLSVNGWRTQITLYQEHTTQITRQDMRGQGMGGWTLSVLHSYDPSGHVLNLGDGTRREVDQLTANVVTTIAGDGSSTFGGEGVSALNSGIAGPSGITVGPDRSVYVVDNTAHRVTRVDPNGILHTVAGTGVRGFSGDGGQGIQAQLANPTSVALGLDGSVYISDRSNFRVRRVGPDGVISTFAGIGVMGVPDEGALANATSIFPRNVAVGPDGRVFISDAKRIWVVDQNGVINAYAGSDALTGGDGGPALQAGLASPSGMSFSSEGTLFFVDANSIRKVTPQGIISTVAGPGPGNGSFSGDGGPALSAGLDAPRDVTVGRDGSFYIAATNRVRRVGTDGIINTFTGNGAAAPFADGGPGPQTTIATANGVASGADQAIYVADAGHHRIRRVASALPGLSSSDIVVPSIDGGEAYIFTGEGRHLRTVNGLTGATLLQFTYDSSGYPVAVTDGDGNITTIERNGVAPTAIVAPGGQPTRLATDGNGWLAQVSNPANESDSMQYSASGLLTTLVDARLNSHRFTYDAGGRLIKDEDPSGGSVSLARTEQTNGFTVATTSALGRTLTYQVEQLSSGTTRRTVTNASGSSTVTIIAPDGTVQTTGPTGTASTFQFSPDPRWGMVAPVAALDTLVSPAGLKRSTTAARTVTLADAANPFSLSRLTDTFTTNGKVASLVYDAPSRSFTIASPAQRSTILTIDPLGRVTQEQIATLAPDTFAYTSGLLGSIVSGTISPRTMSFQYSATRDLTQVTDPLGRLTSIAYDSVQRPTALMLPGNRLVTFSYDASGNVTGITPPSRPPHSFSYSAVDLETEYDAPAGSAVNSSKTTVTYNSDRQPTLTNLADGRTVARSYDAGGRLTGLILSQGTRAVTYSANSGLVAGLSAPGGINHAFVFDGSLLLSHTLSGPVSGSVSWTYDNDFRLLSESVNGGNTVNLAYDLDNLLTQVGALTLTRDAANGLLTGTRLSNITDTIVYSAFAEISDYRAKFNAADVYHAQFTRDAMGRITQKVETIQGTTDTYAYGYDAAGRLINVTKNVTTNSTYTYDPNSNRTGYTGSFGSVTTGQVTVDAQDRLTAYGGNSYSYDANGDLVTKTSINAVTSYMYDELGNLTRVVLPDGNVIDYVVDALNRRIAKKINGAVVRRWLWGASLQIVAELDGSGNLISRFVYASSPTVPDYVVQGGTTYRLIADYLGSPRLLINSSTGAIAGSMNHDEYGRVTTDSIQGLIPFGYAGGLYDSNTGLVRFGARDYDPELGRWTTKDPVLFEGGDTNLYAYALQDPINWADSGGYQGSNQGADINNVISVDPNSPISQFAQSNLYNDNVVIDYVEHGLPPSAKPSVAKQRAESIARQINDYLKTHLTKIPRKDLSIRLWVCYSATTTGGPEGDIAQIVANRTRIPVVAPTDAIEVAGEVIRHSDPKGEDVLRTPWQPPTMQVPAIQIPKFK
jgi:RHS repeat-associated protein